VEERKEREMSMIAYHLLESRTGAYLECLANKKKMTAKYLPVRIHFSKLCRQK
jgi:hypothetical protein